MTAIERVDARTPMVKLNADNTGLAEPLVYPYYLRDMLNDNPHLSIGSFIYTKNLADFHLAPVIVDARPAGDVAEFDQIVLRDDGYHQTWKIRAFNEEELTEAFEKERHNRSDQVQALEDTLRGAYRTYTYKDLQDVEQSFVTSFETDIVLRWMARQIYLTTQPEDATAYLYPSTDQQVVTTAKEALRVVNLYFSDFATLMDKLNQHRYNLSKATRETGLPSYPDWIN